MVFGVLEAEINRTQLLFPGLSASVGRICGASPSFDAGRTD